MLPLEKVQVDRSILLLLSAPGVLLGDNDVPSLAKENFSIVRKLWVP